MASDHGLPDHGLPDHGLPDIGRIGLVLPTGIGLVLPTGTAAANREGGGDDPGTFQMLVELARHAERTGFDALWVEDGTHHALEACSALGALAMITDRPSLGALVADPFRRHPSTFAKQMTTVDVLTGGRAALGIAPPAGPVRQFAEVLQVVRALFTVDAPTWGGRWYRLDGAANRPPPVRAGGCPILVGPVDTAPDPAGSYSGRRAGDVDGSGSPADGLGPAARWADGVIFGGSADAVAPVVDRLFRYCRQVGRDASELTLLWTGEVAVGSTLEAQLHRMVDAGIQGFAARIAPRPARSGADGSGRPAVFPDPDDVTAVAGVLRAVVRTER